MSEQVIVWKHKAWQFSLVALLSILAYFVFREGLDYMVLRWSDEEYSHAYMLPFVALFLVWQRASILRQIPFTGSWWGPVVVGFGLIAFIAGELGTLYSVVQYGFLITLGGLLLSFLGWRPFWVVLPAYILLFFLVPLPNFLYENLSAQLQLISSQIGVWVIRLFGVSVYLEGNVIDLGTYQLQVAEACSGLRYLFPLTALGFIAAVIFRGELWKKVVLFLSTIPITILMNSFRIGVIGVMVEYGGIGMAEGFLHDFEGWVVFMACAAILVLEMFILARIGPRRMQLRDAFAIEGPAPLPADAVVRYRPTPWSFWFKLGLLVVGAIAAQLLPNRAEVLPERKEFLFFPRTLAEWQGHSETMEAHYRKALKLDDYLLANYRTVLGDSVNLYMAYYASQRKGASVHSPKSCLPGGGWQIKSFSQVPVPVGIAGDMVRANRALIQMGEDRRLVYYWFQQRGRLMTNEYLVKWFLFWDALAKNRTDGALVRVTVTVPIGEDLAAYDKVLSSFVATLWPNLSEYIPD
jgi:exosortase D (VPLPA-CTERM-specific)